LPDHGAYPTRGRLLVFDDPLLDQEDRPRSLRIELNASFLGIRAIDTRDTHVYHSFAVGEDNFVRSFESAFARLQVAFIEACRGSRDWPHSVAAGVRVGLDFAAADPHAVAALTTEAMAHGVEGIERYERLVAYLREQLAPGREQLPVDEQLPDVIEHALASGVLMLVAQRLDQGRVAELPALAPEVVQFVLTPYLGAPEARRLGQEML
jgi:hypothetical protein